MREASPFLVTGRAAGGVGRKPWAVWRRCAAGLDFTVRGAALGLVAGPVFKTGVGR